MAPAARRRSRSTTTLVLIRSARCGSVLRFFGPGRPGTHDAKHRIIQSSHHSGRGHVLAVGRTLWAALHGDGGGPCGHCWVADHRARLARPRPGAPVLFPARRLTPQPAWISLRRPNTRRAVFFLRSTLYFPASFPSEARRRREKRRRALFWGRLLSALCSRLSIRGFRSGVRPASLPGPGIVSDRPAGFQQKSHAKAQRRKGLIEWPPRN